MNRQSQPLLGVAGLWTAVLCVSFAEGVSSVDASQIVEATEETKQTKTVENVAPQETDSAQGGAALPTRIFPCAKCVYDRDCHETMEWKLWRTDGYEGSLLFFLLPLICPIYIPFHRLYLHAEVNMTQVCVHQDFIGCNGAAGPEFCDAATESCALSQAFFNESARLDKHSVCSAKAHKSRRAHALSKVIPIGLTVCATILILLALWDIAAYLRLSKVLVAVSIAMVLACCGTFWSPFMYIGVAGVLAVFFVLVAHYLAVPGGRAGKGVSLQWYLLATMVSLLPLLVAWLVRGVLMKGCDGAACAAFYDGYYEIDQRLISPSHNSQVRYHSLCSRAALARALWNVAAVVFLSFLLGMYSLLSEYQKKTSSFQEP